MPISGVGCHISPRAVIKLPAMLVQAIALWVEKTAPFLLLLSVVFVFAHFPGKWLQAGQNVRHDLKSPKPSWSLQALPYLHGSAWFCTVPMIC